MYLVSNAIGLDADALDRHQDESPIFLIEVIKLVNTTTLGWLFIINFSRCARVLRDFVPSNNAMLSSPLERFKIENDKSRSSIRWSFPRFSRYRHRPNLRRIGCYSILD
jgi:hypothetical protein